MDLAKPSVCAQLFSILLGFDGLNVDRGALHAVDAPSMLVDEKKRGREATVIISNPWTDIETIARRWMAFWDSALGFGLATCIMFRIPDGYSRGGGETMGDWVLGTFPHHP